MVELKNKVCNAHIKREHKEALEKLSKIAENKSYLFLPFKGIRDEIFNEFSEFKLRLFSTSPKTLVLEDLDFRIVFKIIYINNLKHRLSGFFENKGLKIYRLSQYFRKKNIKIAEVLGYGKFLKNPFYVVPKMKGESFLEIAKRNDKNVLELFYKIIDEIIKIHKEGYFIGDANIKHFFFLNCEVEGIIDFDCFKKVYFLKKNRFCRDIGYLLRPELHLSKEEIRKLVSYYSGIMMFNHTNVLTKIEYYRAKRWKN